MSVCAEAVRRRPTFFSVGAEARAHAARVALSGSDTEVILSRLRAVLCCMHDQPRFVGLALRSNLFPVDNFPIQTDGDNCGVISMMAIAEVTAEIEYSSVGKVVRSDMFLFRIPVAATSSFSEYCYRARYHLMHEVLTASESNVSCLLTLAREVRWPFM